MKQLYFGDCLNILKDLSSKHPQGFIDLIYIDPPFNSKRNYNILFEDLDMTDTKAQREAFADQLTRPMALRAKEAGKYKPYGFDRIQILTIEDIFDEREIKTPGGVDASTFKQSVKDVRPEKTENGFFD